MALTIDPFDANTVNESVVLGAHQTVVDLERDFFPEDPERQRGRRVVYVEQPPNVLLWR